MRERRGGMCRLHRTDARRMHDHGFGKERDLERDLDLMRTRASTGSRLAAVGGMRRPGRRFRRCRRVRASIRQADAGVLFVARQPARLAGGIRVRRPVHPTRVLELHARRRHSAADSVENQDEAQQDAQQGSGSGHGPRY